MRIRSLGLEYTLGWMEDVTKVNGSTTIWRVWVSTFGTMEGCTKDNIRMIRNMVSVYILGQTGGAMRATGTRENSMALVPMLYPRITK